MHRGGSRRGHGGGGDQRGRRDGDHVHGHGGGDRAAPLRLSNG